MTIATLILAAGLAAPSWAQDENWDARLTSAKGEVTVYTAEEPEGIEAADDMPLQAGDRVRTAADSSAELSFDGGSLVVLHSNSDFKLESSRKADSILALTLGSLLAKIEKLSGGLKVRTPTAIAAVRGTEFGVEVSEDAETHVGVFDEGRVEVSGPEGGAGELLKSNQETRVARGGRPLAPYQLKRLMRHRSLVRGFGRRTAALRKRWKALAPEERRALRARLHEKMRERRKERLEKLKERRGQRIDNRQQHRKDLEKMEKRRKEIRERRRRGQ